MDSAYLHVVALPVVRLGLRYLQVQLEPCQPIFWRIDYMRFGLNVWPIWEGHWESRPAAYGPFREDKGSHKH